MFFKRLLFIVAAALVCCSGAVAQKTKEKKIYEEAQGRKLNPEIRMFVTPQICDMKMVTSTRETYGPYAMDTRLFNAKSFSDLTNGQLKNMQNNALYLACREADADAVIEVIYHTWVNESDDKIVFIELSGFPVNYVNFRPASKEEIDMIGVVYPVSNTSVLINPASTTEPNQTEQSAN